ncbi:ethanolamine ammonia-lyase subunit EutB [Aminipila luticellarii]|uniref:Ethanolamine ammonia-lyase large subunit n=1 Tax=Aminipila luticellarii TaxID=2507160 RepID=A0A410PY57_9FIRM|nr:ethanolamine ammonia-lyase subunit EutB [Aminipila luticellarii]QAT43780.1 ethanolamine ammonia-lyase subunit EutB [Aminipila luticellarii]
MILRTKLFGHNYEFKSLREVMAKANEEKSGDKLAGIAAESAEERVAAKVVLSHITLAEIRNTPAVPYEEDEVTRIIQDAVNESIYNDFKNMTVAEFREWLLDEKTTSSMIRRASRGITSEIVAAVCKLMSNLDLIYCAKKMRVSAHCNTTIGLPGTFSSRLQPNHTTDDPKGIMASVMEGLSLGCGDAVIGLNPVDDSVESVARILKSFDEFKNKWEVPTQICVLAHVTTQTEAADKFNAPIDLMFQSIAGSQKGNEAFGLTATMLDEGRDMMLKKGTSTGPNVMYFETGQGSELSSEAHHGWDQVTMEARCYGFAKKYHPFLVNTVVGFIGPEYLYDSKQVIRAGLEDHFMGKLTGIPMGCDACYTNHMKADQNDIENLATLLVAAGCNYIMGVPQGDDCMLMYQCTGYHEAAALREVFGLRPIKEFDMWLEKMGFSENGKLTPLAGDASVFMRK